ncbi:helix-turn-helix domain-containing protein [Streptomyces sp. 4N509B]|uniref:helix-turn-helix domain-containing protein n=1 Tax=Streptomyces sp. 4N509B TaxID=3457413 RepID=UPI003FD5060A
MRDDIPRPASDAPAGARPRAGTGRARRLLPDHPVRVALLDLLAEVGTVTATTAAARLGHSSGLCSFHLRQLARHGLIEEAPHDGGRARPWRLRWESPDEGGQESEQATAGRQATEEFTGLARGLEDESYERWLARRDQAPEEWRHDPSFSTVLHLTPDETAELAAAVRRLLAPYRDRDGRPNAETPGAAPVAVVARLFPLLGDCRGAPPPA